MADEKSAGTRRPMTAKERVKYLLNCVAKWQREGMTGEEAIGKLTEKQYDFLIDHDVDVDALLLTPEQLKAVQTVKKAARPVFENGYKKKYPQDKQALYNGIIEHLKAIGADNITVPAKVNYRDISFTINGEKYALVLSKPRAPKGE